MNITEREQNGVRIFTLEGRVDSEGAVDLDLALQSAVSEGKYKLVLEMAEIRYINSAGLRTLVQLHKRLKRQGGSLTIVNPPDNVIRLFDLVGLDTIFDIHFDAQWNTNAASTNRLPAASREVYYCV